MTPKTLKKQENACFEIQILNFSKSLYFRLSRTTTYVVLVEKKSSIYA